MYISLLLHLDINSGLLSFIKALLRSRNMWSSALNVRCEVTSHRRGLQLWHYAYTFERSMHTNYAFVSNEGTLFVCHRITN